MAKEALGGAQTRPEQGGAIILLSGGPDSATLAHLAEKERKSTGAAINALYLRTGHPSDEAEIEAAQYVADAIGATLEILDISDVIRALGGYRPIMHAASNVATFGNGLILSIAMSIGI